MRPSPFHAVTSRSARTAAPRRRRGRRHRMSAIAGDTLLETETLEETPERAGHGLPLSATIYGLVVAVAALAAALPSISGPAAPPRAWGPYGLLAAGAAASHT